MSTEQSGANVAYDEARHGCDMQAHFGGQSSLFDGNSAGKYCMSEQNVNRLVPFAELVPTGRDESSSEEEEDDLNSQYLEDEPIGPTLADHPYLRVRSKMPQLCATCFSTVLPVRLNLCPECDCRDSMIPKNSVLAEKSRTEQGCQRSADSDTLAPSRHQRIGGESHYAAHEDRMGS